MSIWFRNASLRLFGLLMVNFLFARLYPVCSLNESTSSFLCHYLVLVFAFSSLTSILAMKPMYIPINLSCVSKAIVLIYFIGYSLNCSCLKVLVQNSSFGLVFCPSEKPNSVKVQVMYVVHLLKLSSLYFHMLRLKSTLTLGLRVFTSYTTELLLPYFTFMLIGRTITARSQDNLVGYNCKYL